MIVVGILNYNRSIEYVDELIESTDIDCIENIIISTDKPWEYHATSNHVIDNSTENIAQAKNSIIKKARELKATKLFIIEDDVEILDDSIFDQYLNMMDTFNLGCLFNGYTNHSNYVLTKPSPRVRLIFDDLCKACPAVITNRHECGDFILIDLEKNHELFSEELKYFEFAEWCYRCWKEGHIYGLNQFLDIPNAWDYIKPREDTKSLRKDDQIAIKKDKEIMDGLINNGWKIENSVGVIVSKLREQIGV